MSTKRLLRGTGCGIIGLAIAGCAPEPAPFNPAEFTRGEYEAADEVLPRERQALPTTLRNPVAGEDEVDFAPPTTGPVIGTEPVVRVSLQEAIQRAVLHNPDVRVEAYNPAIEETRVTQEEAAFDPAVFSRASFERRDETTINPGGIITPTGPLIVDSETVDLRAGLRQQLPSGGQAELRYQSLYTDADETSAFPNPAWDNELVLQITQPLLRNFGTSVNRARISVARNNQHVSVLEFRNRLEETLFNIEDTYWQLVQAQEDVLVAEKLLGSTLDTAFILKERMGLDVTRLQMSQTNASVHTRQVFLIRARARVRDLSDQLKRLMSDPDLPVTSPVLVLPATEPVLAPLTFDLDEQIEAGLLHRAELGQQALRIQNTDVLVDVARNNLLPELNLLGSTGVQGLDEDFGDAADNQSEFENINWAIGLEFEIPIGNRAARATYRRALLQRMQAQTQYLALAKQIAVEVKTAVRAVDTNWTEMVARRDEVFAAADALDAIEQRERANEPLTPDFVDRKLNAQARLAEAQVGLAAAEATYNRAIAGLERAKGTLLRYNNVAMEEAAPNFDLSNPNQ